MRRALAVLMAVGMLAGCTSPRQEAGGAGYTSPNTPDPRNVRFHKHTPPTPAPRTGLHVHGSASVGIIKTF